MITNRFDVIASSYEKALAKYPNCRFDHNWLLKNSNLSEHSSVLEISGGTGFLTKHIMEKVPHGKIIVQDVSNNVLEINAEKNDPKGDLVKYIVEADMQFPSFSGEEFDAVITLGGFHHIEDQVTFAKSLNRMLKKNGIACIGDFIDDSSMQRYFDEKVHYVTETGHMGLFASVSRLINLARFANFTKVKVEKVPVPFSFKSPEEIGEFFQLVHDLDQDPKDTYKDIQKYFTIMESSEGLSVIIDYVYAAFQK